MRFTVETQHLYALIPTRTQYALIWNHKYFSRSHPSISVWLVAYVRIEFRFSVYHIRLFIICQSEMFRVCVCFCYSFRRGENHKQKQWTIFTHEPTAILCAWLLSNCNFIMKSKAICIRVQPQIFFHFCFFFWFFSNAFIQMEIVYTLHVHLLLLVWHIAVWQLRAFCVHVQLFCVPSNTGDVYIR